MNNNFFEKTLLNKKTVDNIKLCKQFIEQNNLETMECGSYKIDSDNVFVNIFCYNSNNPSERIWEAHKKYIDLHYVINGREIVWIDDISNMQIGAYDEDNDYLALEGNPTQTYVLEKGDFCLCLAFEGHKTGIKIKDVTEIKKAVFKIKID